MRRLCHNILLLKETTMRDRLRELTVEELESVSGGDASSLPVYVYQQAFAAIVQGAAQNLVAAVAATMPAGYPAGSSCT
jgi:hypothetical protein